MRTLAIAMMLALGACDPYEPLTIEPQRTIGSAMDPASDPACEDECPRCGTICCIPLDTHEKTVGCLNCVLEYCNH